MKYFYYLLLIFIPIQAAATPLDPITRFSELDSMIIILGNNKPAEAISYSNEQLQIAQKLANDSLIYIATDRRARLLDELGLYDESLKMLYVLLPKFEARTHDPRTGEIYYNIGNTYFQMRDHNSALDYYQKSKQAYILAGKPKDTTKVNFEIGLELVGTGKSAEGIQLIRHNLEVSQANHDDEATILGLDDLSNCYMEIGDYENSLKYQKELLNYPSVTKTNNIQAGINQHLAEILIEMKRYKDAQPYVTNAIHYASEMGSNDWLFDCYKNQAAIDEALGNYKSALENHKKYLALKDSVYKSDYDTKMSAMASLYELDHKQNAIRNLEKDKHLASVQIQRLYLILIALALLVILTVLWFYLRKNKAAQALREQFSAQLIQAQEEERQRIAKGLHDSVGQNILFIKNQVRHLFADSKPGLTQSVDDALEEVRNISKDLYPNQLEQYGLISSINDLCEKVRESTNIFVSSDIEMQNESHLSSDTRINCYRIIQECINNTIKHAAATAIRITGSLMGNQLQLIIQDNGCGFEKANLRGGSFGMLNMEERVRILRGKFELDTAPGKGTRSVFTIPVY